MNWRLRMRKYEWESIESEVRRRIQVELLKSWRWSETQTSVWTKTQSHSLFKLRVESEKYEVFREWKDGFESGWRIGIKNFWVRKDQLRIDSV